MTGAGAPAMVMSAEERRLGFVIAGASMLFFTVYWRPWEGGSRFGLWAIGSAVALAVGLCTWWGYRIAAATASFCLAIFGSWPTIWHYLVAWVVGLGFACWIALAIVRSSRAQT